MQNQPINYARHIRLVVFSFVVQGVFYLRGMLLLPLLTRCLGPEAFGSWSKMQAALNLVTPLVGLGATLGALRYVPGADRERRGVLMGTALVAIAATTAIVMLGAAATFPVQKRLFLVGSPGDFTFAMATVLWVAVPSAALLQLSKGYFRARERPVMYGVLVCLEVGSMILCTLLAWRGIGASLWVPLLAFSAMPLAVSLYGLAHVLRDSGIAVSQRVLRELVKYGAPLLPVGTLVWTGQFADRYMMTFLIADRADEMIGIYAANYTFGGLIALAFSPFFLFYFPTAMRLWEGGWRDHASHLTCQTVKYGMICGIPILLTAPVIARRGVPLVAGKAFEAAPEVMFLVMLGYLFLQLADLVAVPIYGERRTRLLLGHHVVAVIANVCANWLLIPRIDKPWGGMTGAALATGLSFGLFLLLNVRAATRISPGKLEWWPLAKVFAAALGCAFAMRAWAPDTGLSLILATVVVGSLYGSLLLALRAVSLDELRSILGAVSGLLCEVRERVLGQ
ncbi:polysaccharide biosynthesis C-terminal domain-containing protein [Candidatus Latescibacterota bacterium]